MAEAGRGMKFDSGLRNKGRGTSRSTQLADVFLEHGVWLGEANEAMQIGSRDTKAARGEGLVAVVFADGGGGEFDFVVAEFAFKGTVGLIVA